MGRSNRTPERSKIARGATQAFARRQRTGSEGDDKDDDKDEIDRSMEETRPEIGPHVQPRPEPKSAAQPAQPKPDELPVITPPDPGGVPWADATPPPMKPVEPARAQTLTVTVPADLGRPPEMPTTTAPPPLTLGAVENPAHMPGPREIPGGEPNDPAPAPGYVPRGDSRSLRRGNEFALIYRVQTFVIWRVGTIGTRGQWRVVEYPTSSAASHAYAKEASRFVSEGFSDYRE
ncbi:MAG: hypothetical protein JO257_02805 [Deltaproteobacteria bacterium]|nr:hypothetical protein [Deltaproteobacteria bacterium]